MSIKYIEDGGTFGLRETRFIRELILFFLFSLGDLNKSAINDPAGQLIKRSSTVMEFLELQLFRKRQLLDLLQVVPPPCYP